MAFLNQKVTVMKLYTNIKLYIQSRSNRMILALINIKSVTRKKKGGFNLQSLEDVKLNVQMK